MFYSEIKERESILHMINATVSHELRNPLNAIIDQKNIIADILAVLMAIIVSLQGHKIYSDLCKKLTKIHEKFDRVQTKITSATKFIDFFIHDMLDFAVLTKTDEGFIRQNSTFNVKIAIQEIIAILENKIKFKRLEIKEVYENFKTQDGTQNFMIKTDQKRLQQVILNLMSNAVKFSQTHGLIIIRITRCKSESHDGKEILKVSVNDHGIGIRKRDKKRLFQLYGSIKNEKMN